MNDDPDFARMHLQGVERALPLAEQSCRQGVAANCRLARFLAEAQAGLQCHAGVAGASRTAGAGAGSESLPTGNRPAQAAPQDPASRSRAGAASAGECVCGPDYIPCWVRKSKASGGRYSLSSSDGWDNIAAYDKAGRHAGTKGWKRGTAECSAIVK